MNRSRQARLLTAAGIFALALGCSGSPPVVPSPDKNSSVDAETTVAKHDAAPDSVAGPTTKRPAAPPDLPTPQPKFSPEEAEAAIKELGGIARLSGAGIQVVSLADTLTTDDDLRMLSALPELQALFLGNTRITSAGLVYLAPLKNLEKLSLSRDAVTDLGLEHLVGLNNLKHLDLFQTAITDAGLEHVSRLEGLETLKLNDTNITDQGLRRLSSLTQLKRIWLKGTQVTPKGIEALKAAIAGLKVL